MTIFCKYYDLIYIEVYNTQTSIIGPTISHDIRHRYKTVRSMTYEYNNINGNWIYMIYNV